MSQLLDQLLEIIEPADISAFYPKKNFYSRACAFFAGKYSHIALHFDLYFLIEAAFPRVRGYPLSRYLDAKHDFDIFWVPRPTMSERISVARKAYSYIGKKYSLRQNLWILLNKTGLDPAGMHCPELVGKSFLEAINLNLRPDIPIYRWRPIDPVNSHHVVIKAKVRGGKLIWRNPTF